MPISASTSIISTYNSVFQLQRCRQKKYLHFSFFHRNHSSIQETNFPKLAGENGDESLPGRQIQLRISLWNRVYKVIKEVSGVCPLCRSSLAACITAHTQSWRSGKLKMLTQFLVNKCLPHSLQRSIARCLETTRTCSRTKGTRRCCLQARCPVKNLCKRGFLRVPVDGTAHFPTQTASWGKPWE